MDKKFKLIINKKPKFNKIFLIEIFMESNSLLMKIKNPVFKLLSGYIGIRELMNIFKNSKYFQNKLNIGLSSYKIFSFFLKNQIDVLNNKKLFDFYYRLIRKLKENSLEEIQIGLCICILFSLKYNYTYDANMIEYELYPIYLLLRNQFGIALNLMYTEKFFKQNLFGKNYYINFIKNNIQRISGITFSQIQSDVLLKFFGNSNKEKVALFNNLELKQLNFKNMKLTKDVSFLLDQINFKYLKILTFIECKLTLNCLDIFNKKILDASNLIKLIFFQCSINVKNIGKISNSYNNLSYINLSKNKIDDNAMSIFLENEFCKNLITLDLSSNKISNESIKKISHSLNYFLNLKKLNLANNFLKHSIKDLFDWKNPNLTYLDLTNCQIEDYEFNDELINNLENLSHLVLNKNLLGKRAIKFCFSLKSLISLYLSLCGLNDDDSFSLIKDIRNTNLKMLSLSNNDITSETIISLFKNQIFQKLYILDLFGNQLNDFFVDYLIKNKNNIPIQVLNIGLNHKISSEKKMQIYGLFKKYTKVTNKGNYT
jgi:hypothetical protein